MQALKNLFYNLYLMKKIALWSFILFILWFSFVNASKEDLKICTFEYQPVCWVDWKTYGNECVASNVKIAHKWECTDDKIMEDACPANFMPVFWTDWKIYWNECEAKRVWVFDKKLKIDNEKILNSYLDFSIAFPVWIKDKKDFLVKYWKNCITASDSINSHFIKDWKFLGSTRVWVPKDFKPNYTCLAFKGLVLDKDLRLDFKNSLEKLNTSEIKKINSALKKFYKNINNFDENLAKTQDLLRKIDEMKEKRKFRTEKPILFLDYIKYQVTELFTQK